MKRLLTLLFCVASFSVYGQGVITFDPGHSLDYHAYITIDTTYHHNIWQVGKPHKVVFDSAYSYPDVIVTDTLNPYPVNDTSVFILKVPGNIGGSLYGVQYLTNFSFYYQLDINSGAIAKVEVSDDSGFHWTNLIDSLPQNFLWSYSGIADTPNLKTSTTGWAQFSLVRPRYSPIADIVLFRFTFISDSIDSSKDGWIIDNINFTFIYDGVLQIQNSNLISIYPNPSKGNIYIHSTKQYTDEPSVIIYNIKGQEVYKTDKLLPSGYLNLPLPDGVYTLKYFTKEEYCVKRIVITK